MPVKLLVTESAGITISGLDLVIEFDPARFSVSGAQLGSLLSGAGFSGLLTQPAPGKTHLHGLLGHGHESAAARYVGRSGDAVVHRLWLMPRQARP